MPLGTRGGRPLIQTGTKVFHSYTALAGYFIMIRTSFAIAIIIILGAGVYFNSINGEFVYDDKGLVRDNVYITNPAYIPKAFTENIFSGSGVKSSFYRPLQMFSYTMDHIFWKKESRGYHVTNIALHILVALALYWFISLMFQDALLSLFASLMFVVHPIHTEAVSYIAGRADPMAALFMLLCFICYLKGLRLAVLCYALALLSKETALVLPFLLLLYPNRKRSLFLPIASLSVLYIILRLTVLKHVLFAAPAGTTLVERIPGFFVAIANYMRILIAPFGLHMEYAEPPFSMGNPLAIFGALVVLFLLAFAVKARKNNKLIFFSIMWFFIALIPVSNLFPINSHMAEHWLYVPSIGFFILLAYFTLSRRLIAVLLIALYLVLTINQNAYWKGPISFYERTIKYAPQNARICTNLATNYITQGKMDEAIALYKRAIKANPAFAEAYNNLGNIYNSRGKKKEAISLYEKAISINPNYTDAYNNLGVVHYELGKTKEAKVFYEKALELNPHHTNARNNLTLLKK